MSVPYEKRRADFYCRDDAGGTVRLACSAHLHVHIELFYLLKGQMRAYIDSDEYTVRAGDVLISFPNQVHRFERVKNEKYLLFIVHPDMIPEFSSVFSKQLPTSALVERACDDPMLLSLLQQLQLASQQEGPYRDLMLRGLLLAFFGRLLPELELTEPRAEDSHALREVVTYCTENFTHDLSLETLEKALHLSRFYISHLFSHKLRIRFNDYVNSLRVSEACRLLRSTDRSITDIGNSVGFNTLRTFNRSFMKQMAQSPSDYRRSYVAVPGGTTPNSTNYITQGD